MSVFCTVDSCFYNTENRCKKPNGPHIREQGYIDKDQEYIRTIICADYYFTVGKKYGTFSDNP